MRGLRSCIPLKIFLCAVVIMSLSGCGTPGRERLQADMRHMAPQEFRDATLRLIRAFATEKVSGQAFVPEKLKIRGRWQVEVTLYNNGDVKGYARGTDALFSRAVKKTVYALCRAAFMDIAMIEKGCFWVNVRDDAGFSQTFIEFKGKGLELADDVTACRRLTKELIKEKVEAGKLYLLSHMDKEKHAFYKRYDVVNDDYTTRLRTIYTASALYSLLKISDTEYDPQVEHAIPLIAEFLLSMQSTDEKTNGAFCYSYYTDTDKKEQRFVSGTAAKTIFTLLELSRRISESRYLASGRAAGDWLLSMQNDDASVKPQAAYHGNVLVYEQRNSFLYNGQALSALSRLYTVTQEKKYYDAAEKIARLFKKSSRESGFFVGDDYRRENVVSTSWVVMALLDYYKVSNDEDAWDVLTRCADELLKRQCNDPFDILDYGRFTGTRAGSGNGWINEVLNELYVFSKEHDKNMEQRERYKEAILKVTRWLIQNTYSPENTYFLKNPEKAFGGLIRNSDEESVRTDAVCHGLNSYITMLGYLEDGELLNVPEN
ncbi:MAG: hypothetical protein KJ893_03265 [Candidatus Omnitrophica bacterium]|nr:hypothetical protein [Candidatus Omnitrophota bacterium]MBU4478082.1 hypothetical protein [Candidatus Omnitrophota bacterium]